MVTLTENRRHATIWVSFPLPQADKEKLFKKVKSALPGLRSSLHRSFTRRMLPEFEVALAHEEVGSFLDR